MSLINEALKKAQRQRSEDTAAPSAPVSEPGASAGAETTAAAPAPAMGVRIPKRGKAPAAQTMVLVGSGAVVLVVLSVVLTVYLLNRPSDASSKPGAAIATSSTSGSSTPGAKSGSTPEVSTQPIVAPAITPPSIAPASADSSTTSATPPAPAGAGATSTAPAGVVSSVSGAETTTATAAATPSTTGVPAVSKGPDERVAAFVEAIRVTGIRSSGTESRVLMNERVYRVNDVVERTLGVRLIKVSTDSLTFSDPNGVTYEKHF